MIKINNYLAISSYEEYMSMNHTEFVPDLVLVCAKELVVGDNENNPSIIKYDIIDGCLLSFLTRIDDIIRLIHNTLNDTKKVLICCDNTLSRSMSVVVYYLVTHKNQIYSSLIGSYFMTSQQGITSEWSIHPVFDKYLSSL
jgi:hypothetical protein